MKKFFAALLCACTALFVSVQAAEIDMHDPYKMVTAVADQTFTKIKANSDKMKDVNFRKELIRQDLMPYVDTTYASYKVLGQNLKSTTKEERAAFTQAFADYIVASYADALGLYTKQDLVLPDYKKVADDATQVNIKFLIREDNKPDLELIFKLRKNKKTGEWRAFDMIAEGISMLTSKTNELTPLFRTKGVPAVTQLLLEHNASGSTEAIK